jgi:hypothetical protein
LVKNLKDTANLKDYDSISKPNGEAPKIGIFDGEKMLYNSNSKIKMLWTYGYSLIKFKNFIESKKQ